MQDDHIILRMQDWSDIQKSNNIIHHSDRIKKINQMIVSKDRKKPTRQNLTPFTIKIQLTDKDHLWKYTANITLNGKECLSPYHQEQGRDVHSPNQQCTEIHWHYHKKPSFTELWCMIYDQNSKLTSEGVLKLISSKQPSNIKLNVGSIGKKTF